MGFNSTGLIWRLSTQIGTVDNELFGEPLRIQKTSFTIQIPWCTQLISNEIFRIPTVKEDLLFQINFIHPIQSNIRGQTWYTCGNACFDLKVLFERVLSLIKHEHVYFNILQLSVPQIFRLEKILIQVWTDLNLKFLLLPW